MIFYYFYNMKYFWCVLLFSVFIAVYLLYKLPCRADGYQPGLLLIHLLSRFHKLQQASSTNQF